MHAVFLRGANVGGKNVFRPAELVKQLGPLDVVNVGAAGTFLVRGKATRDEIRRAVAGALPFTVEMAVVPARDVVKLVERAPLAGEAFSKDLRGWVAALDGKPKQKPALPVEKPAGDGWSIRLLGVEGAFALGLWRRRPGSFLNPNQLVERTLGVTSTVRWWETLEKIAALVDAARARS